MCKADARKRLLRRDILATILIVGVFYNLTTILQQQLIFFIFLYLIEEVYNVKT